jgi:hypothetical protein
VARGERRGLARFGAPVTQHKCKAKALYRTAKILKIKEQKNMREIEKRARRERQKRFKEINCVFLHEDVKRICDD